MPPIVVYFLLYIVLCGVHHAKPACTKSNRHRAHNYLDIVWVTLWRVREDRVDSQNSHIVYFKHTGVLGVFQRKYLDATRAMCETPLGKALFLQ